MQTKKASPKAQTILVLSLLIISTISLVFLSGCAGLQRGKQEPTSATYTATGSEGIVMNFVKDQPPQRIYENTPLSVLVEVRNKGIYETSDINLWLTGFDPKIIPLADAQKRVGPIEGKSQFNTEGGYESVSFESGPVLLPDGTDRYNPKLLLTACYPYKTIANPIVCIDPNPQDLLSEKACLVKNVAGGTQGAPVAISSIEEEVTPEYIYFRLHLQNVGKGVVFDNSKMGACPNELQYSDLNKLTYESVSLPDGRAGECNPAPDKLRLVDGRATVFCKFPQQGGSAYETTLRIVLSYAYKESIFQNIEVRNLD